jgi:signal transduction histidine kinase
LKIRQRLALRFTLVSALVVAAILTLIYTLTWGFIHSDFAARLAQQSQLEVLHYASPGVGDVASSGPFFLVNPVTSIYSSEGALLHSKGAYEIPSSWVSYLQKNALFDAERGKYTTVGRKYDIDGKQYLVFVSDKDLPGQHELGILLNATILGYVVSLLFSYMAGLYFSGNALQPVKHVVEEVNQITKDNLSYRLTLNKQNSTTDEIDELVLTFNALLTRIESAFISQKRFVQNASHELKTPLTAIMAEAELALTRERPVEEYKRTLQVVLLETERLVRITQGLLTLTRVEEADFQNEMVNVDVCSLINSTVSAFKLHHPDRTLVVADAPHGIQVPGNEQLLQIAVLNMLDNAVKYSDKEITISITVDGEHASIGVADKGIGIPESDLAKIRSPLFRASNVGDVQGAGLGLSLVARIVRIHGGQLSITSDEGKGTFSQVTLPRAQL